MTAGTRRDRPSGPTERQRQRTAPGAGMASAPTAAPATDVVKSVLPRCTAAAHRLGSILPVPLQLTAIQPVLSCPITVPRVRTRGQQPGSPPGVADTSRGVSPRTPQAPRAGRSQNASRAGGCSAPHRRVENHTEHGRGRGNAHGFYEGCKFVFPVYQFFQLQLL